MRVASAAAGDPSGHFADIGIGTSVGIVMQIMKFADPRKSGFQHLDIGLRGDRLDLIRRHSQREAIHGLAPAPEIVGARTAPLREAGHRALKRMAVHIGHSRHAERVPLIAGTRRRANFDRCDRAGIAGSGARRCASPAASGLCRNATPKSLRSSLSPACRIRPTCVPRRAALDFVAIMSIHENPYPAITASIRRHGHCAVQRFFLRSALARSAAGDARAAARGPRRHRARRGGGRSRADRLRGRRKRTSERFAQCRGNDPLRGPMDHARA